MHCISFLQMPPTRFLSFLFSLLIFCAIAESSPFAGNIKACFLDQPKPKAIPAQGSKPTQRTVPKIETEIDSEQIASSEVDCSTNKKLHYIASAFTVVSALMSYNAAKSYNELSSKNSSLATQYKNSSKSSEKASYKSEYDNNASKMKTYKSKIQSWDLLTLAGLSWNVYLLMTDDSEDTVSNYSNLFSSLIPQLVIKTTLSEPKNIFRWKWRF